MELRVLRYFLVVAQEENITQAAKKLHLTQPTLSRQMMLLEQELGVTLFDRGRRRISLTASGLLLRERAAALLALSEKTAEDLRARGEAITGEICLALRGGGADGTDAAAAPGGGSGAGAVGLGCYRVCPAVPGTALWAGGLGRRAGAGRSWCGPLSRWRGLGSGAAFCALGAADGAGDGADMEEKPYARPGCRHVFAVAPALPLSFRFEISVFLPALPMQNRAYL